MAQLAQEKSSLESAMAEPHNQSDMADMGRRLKALGDETDALEARWLELHEAIEELSQS
jgi:ATP-binding cassette subfamily F protein 3